LAEPNLSEKVDFLRKAESYGGLAEPPVAIETHMSCVFLAGDKVFKLKKPVRFPYLDFSTLARREAACRAELRLNRRLAPSVYLEVVPLCSGAQGLSIGGEGKTVDWLVVMRRLDLDWMLDHAIRRNQVSGLAIERVTNMLARFYRSAGRLPLSPASHLRDWERNVEANRKLLLHHDFGLPMGPIRRIDCIQRRFLAERQDLLADRVRDKRIIDGHGDLRPEHIWLGEPPQIIDRLEFNPGLRAVDPFDEIAFLGIECERLGAPFVGPRIKEGLARALHDRIPDELFSFYRCYRASLRTRLTIAHLLEPAPRTPEKWPWLARDYLTMAEREAVRLERLLRKRGDRPARGPRAAGGWSRQTARPKRG
jgi:aminoglycoside phosphotransferase family enzyme